MPVDDAARFSTLLRQTETIEASAVLFRQAISAWLFETFACLELDVANKERHAFYVIDWPADWRNFYFSNNILARDPVVDALAHYREPFTWSDIVRDLKLPQQALQIFHSARRHGFNDGLVIPILRAGRSRFGLVRLAGCSPDIDAESRTTLSLMGICFFHHVRALVPHSGFAKPPANLTAREIECIRLVARGFSDRRLGTTLSISQSTAHEHVESAKRKLRVSTRAELIGVAASLAIIAS